MEDYQFAEGWNDVPIIWAVNANSAEMDYHTARGWANNFQFDTKAEIPAAPAAEAEWDGDEQWD